MPPDGADSGDPEASGCPYRLCDGFEDPTFAPVWTIQLGTALDTTIAHSGRASLHVHTDAVADGGDGFAGLGQAATLPLHDPVVYVRAWIRLGNLPLNNMELVIVEQAAGTNEDALFVVPGALSVYSQFDEANEETTAPPATGAWFCALWTVTRATTATGSLALAGDFGPITLANVRTDSTQRPLTEMIFGIGLSGVNVAQPAMDVWFDDILVAAAPVTCTQ